MFRIYQLSKDPRAVRGFGKVRVSERIGQDFSQASPDIRVIVSYQDIQRYCRLSGQKFNLKLLYPGLSQNGISVGCDLCKKFTVDFVGIFLQQQRKLVDQIMCHGIAR